MAAFERGKLEEGENAIPYAQYFLAGVSRVTYFYHPNNNLRIDLQLGCLFAICINAYTGLVAVNVANADQRKLMMMMMWFGLQVFILYSCVPQIDLVY
jgi:hypothetical protein